MRRAKSRQGSVGCFILGMISEIRQRRTTQSLSIECKIVGSQCAGNAATGALLLRALPDRPSAIAAEFQRQLLTIHWFLRRTAKYIVQPFSCDQHQHDAGITENY
jgi:hypothetical protein